MSFDEEPEDIHGECRHEIERLTAELAQAQDELREARKQNDWRKEKLREQLNRNASFAAQVAVMANSLKKLKKLFASMYLTQMPRK